MAPKKMTPTMRRLIALRTNRGWGQKEMAKFLQVGHRTYQRYEAGLTIPGPVKKLIKLMEENVI